MQVWGGVPIEAWTSEEALKEFPNILSTVQKNKDTAYINSFSRRRFEGNGNMPEAGGSRD